MAGVPTPDPIPTIRPYLDALVSRGGSDLHLKPGGHATVRVDGELEPLTSLPRLTEEDTARMSGEALDGAGQWNLDQSHAADAGLTVQPSGSDVPQRFRVTAFRERGNVGLVLRLLPPPADGPSSLGMPASVTALAEHRHGLVLVSGPTGAGKTTTAAAMLQHINNHRRCHIVTVEDPIEALVPARKAQVTQRQVGEDTTSFTAALRESMRQDPDVLFIGEIRSWEAAEASLSAAETGHLVIATTHTTDVSSTLRRLVEMHPPHKQQVVRDQLASTLQGVVSQRLLPAASGRGRVAAVEVLVGTARTRELVSVNADADAVRAALRDNAYYGMQTLDDDLLRLVRVGDVAVGDALANASNPHDLRVELRSSGLLS